MVEDVLPLLPLTPVQHRRGPDDLADGGTQLLGPVGDDQQAEGTTQPALDELAEKMPRTPCDFRSPSARTRGARFRP
jgi:hypothetical protein